MSLLDHPLITDRYFFPRPDPPETPWQVEVDGASLNCARYVFDEDAPTLLHFHGNGEVVSDYTGDIVEICRTNGFNVCFAEYRGYGGSTGVPALVSMLADTEAIFSALALPPSRVVVFGRSIGSLYALELASRKPEIAGLILESGIADLLERLLVRIDPEQEMNSSKEALQAEVKRHFDHQQKLQTYQGPLLVLHAKQDHLVGVHHAQQNAAWAVTQDKTLQLFDRGDHNSVMILNWEAYWAAVRRFVEHVTAP